MNTQYAAYVQKFLGFKRIGVAGFSLKNDNPGNLIYKKLKENGYEVFAINPKAKENRAENLFPSIGSVPDQLDGVIICTHPSITESVIEDCAKAGIGMVWIHKSIGEGSFSARALENAQKYKIKVIPIGCPMMFVKPDIFHKCFKYFMKKKLTV